MSIIENTVALPDGRAYATLDTALKIEHVTVTYSQTSSTVSFDLGGLYVQLTLQQWEELKAAAEATIERAAVPA